MQNNAINYAHLNIESSCCIHYGRPCWEARLLELSEGERDALLAKVGHWQELVAREESVG